MHDCLVIGEHAKVGLWFAALFLTMKGIFIMELNLYRIVPKYIDALRDETNGGDKRVYDVRNGKEHRPFVGVVVVCNGQKYCIPLTSYKKRFENMRDKIDITRIIIDGEIKGAVEFSRMIPIEDAQLRNLDMLYHKHDTEGQRQNKNNRIETLKWCREHSDDIVNKANVLYNMYISGQDFKRKKDCLNFIALEEVCKKYNEK